MNSHNGNKKTNNGQAANISAFEKIMSIQSGVYTKIFSYLDLKSIWRLSNVNRLIKQKFLDMSKSKEQEQRIPYKRVSDYEFACDFLNFVYGRGNAERLSKIADEAVKRDASVDGSKYGKSSIFYKVDNIEFYDGHNVVKYGLVKEMLWHMVLLDILNIKSVDFDSGKSLPEVILNVVKQNSQNRLNFLLGDNHKYDDMRDGGFAAALYDYAKLIFKLPDKRKDISTEQEELIKKIFACFIKVSFLRMKQAVRFEPYKNDSERYEFYREAILHLKRCFYMCNKPYKSLGDGIDLSDFWNSGTYVHTDAQDMASYLFLTNELEDLFENNEDFVYDFSFDYYHAADYEYSHFGAFLFFLNKIKPLEKRYTENKDKFMEMFVSVKNVKWVYWDLIEHVQGILTFFENEELRQDLIDNVIKKFKNNFGENSKHVRQQLFYKIYEKNDIFEQEDFLSQQINRTAFKDEEVEKYFGCLIEHFAGNNDCNRESIKMVSDKIFGDGKMTFSDRLSHLNKIESLEKRYKSNKKKFISIFFPAEKYRCLELNEQNLLANEDSLSILDYFKGKKIRSELIDDLNREYKHENTINAPKMLDKQDENKY